MQDFEITELAGLRVDGRKFDELRPMHNKIGILSTADGSASLEQGLNKVMVTVAGPHEPKKRLNDGIAEKCIISCRMIYAPVCASERKKRKQGDRRIMENEKILTDVLESIIMCELYPRSEISIVVHVLETDGSILCCAINTAFLALMSAGISMSDMIAACTVGLIRGHMSLDLTHSEIIDGGAYMPVVIKARSEEIVFVQLDSRLSFDLMKHALESCMEGCKLVRMYLETEMKNYMEQQLERIK